MEWFWLIFLFAIGSCVGSFLNVVIWRLPRGQSIVFPGSHCPTCGQPIKWYDNIPLLSWCLLRGRCRACKTRISPRYLLIEAITAVLVAGLYACYYILDIRAGMGSFDESWMVYAAHAALLCGLLACSVVDIDLWVIPLEVVWFVSGLAVVLWAIHGPHPFMPTVSAGTIGASLAAVVGLVVAILLMRWGFIQPSFIDASDKPFAGESDEDKGEAAHAVAITTAHGVNPRKEVLWEVAFLVPSLALAGGFALLMKLSPSTREAWQGLFDMSGEHPRLAGHLLAAGSAVFGYLIGGLWIWGIRIFGTLLFGKEAMGMGDVHILAAVGAVCGWIVPPQRSSSRRSWACCGPCTCGSVSDNASCPMGPGWRWGPS